MACVDPLFARGQSATAENRLLRSELGHLRAQRSHARMLLRLLIFESASLRAEARSVREEMIYRRSVRPHAPEPPFCAVAGLDAAKGQSCDETA